MEVYGSGDFMHCAFFIWKKNVLTFAQPGTLCLLHDLVYESGIVSRMIGVAV